MAKDAENAKRESERFKKARNKACAIIEDAKNRYIKTKTRAKNKKAAEEKDAVLNSPRFDILKDYERREDIQECYGWDMFNEKERDRLEALWDEREFIKAHVIDGIYEDDVTKALDQAYLAIADIWDENIRNAEKTVKDFNKQFEETRSGE